jgi:hypothetical protein
MKKLFWGLIAPGATLVAGAAVLYFAVYPHCFVKAKYKAVQAGGLSVDGAAVFLSTSYESELISIPNRNGTGHVVYSADTQGETAGLLDKREIIVDLPSVLLVRNADRYRKLQEKEIYDSHEIGHDPDHYHFADEENRRIDVLYVADVRGGQWPPLILTAFRFFLVAGLLLAPPLFIGTGWWALRQTTNAGADWHRRISFCVMILATLDWLALVAMAAGDMFHRAGDLTAGVWVGLVITIGCALGGLAGVGYARRATIYLSASLIFTWAFVALSPF